MSKRKRPENPSRTNPEMRRPEVQRRSKKLGKRLLKRRKQLGLSQSSVAIGLGWQPSRLWEYEAGLSTPRTAALVALAEALQTTADELLKGIDGDGSKS